MATITKEYLDKKFGGIDKKIDQFRNETKTGFAVMGQKIAKVEQKIESEVQNLAVITARHFESVNKQFDVQTAELKTYSDKNQAELARMINTGFDDFEGRLDYKAEVEKLKLDNQMIKAALNIQ